jgi:hypothetical protein
MDEPFLLLLSGPPGAGKTTVGRIVASKCSRSACIQSDWFWSTIVNGHVPPWEAIADRQNQVMIRSALASAVRMADGGYSTVLEGIIGPWYFNLVRDELAMCSVGVSYVVLRPDVDACLARATGRVADGPEHRDALTDEGPIRHMWNEFAHLGDYEHCVVDSSVFEPAATADRVCERLRDGRNALFIE